MPNLTILVESQSVITIFAFHFDHGGHFKIMQIRITYGFGYVLFSMEKIIWIWCLQPFEFRYSNLDGFGLL